jgi:hypothetical protein
VKAFKEAEKEWTIEELETKRNLVDTGKMIDVWFYVNNFTWPQVTEYENVVIDLAKNEWGQKTEVIFESLTKVIVRNGDKEKIFIKSIKELPLPPEKDEAWEAEYQKNKRILGI